MPGSTFKESELAVINNFRKVEDYSNSLGTEKNKDFRRIQRPRSVCEPITYTNGTRNLGRRHDKERASEITHLIGEERMLKFMSIINKT